LLRGHHLGRPRGGLSLLGLWTAAPMARDDDVVSSLGGALKGAGAGEDHGGATGQLARGAVAEDSPLARRRSGNRPPCRPGTHVEGQAGVWSNPHVVARRAPRVGCTGAGCAGRGARSTIGRLDEITLGPHWLEKPRTRTALSGCRRFAYRGVVYQLLPCSHRSHGDQRR